MKNSALTQKCCQHTLENREKIEIYHLSLINLPSWLLLCMKSIDLLNSKFSNFKLKCVPVNINLPDSYNWPRNF